MKGLISLLMGGFLAGYRTKILAGLLILNVVIKVLVGDLGIQEAIETIKANWEQLAIAFGLLAAAAHQPKGS